MIESSKVWQLIEQFMQVIETETGFPVLIYDTEGRIKRSSDKSRIGDLHAGAQKIMRGEVTEYEVTDEEARSNPLVREGSSFPIKVDGKIVAGFGITGKLELARPLAKIAVEMIKSWITEQAYTERLRRSEEKYRNIFNQSLSGIFQTTLDGRPLTANETLADILGYPSASELIQHVTDIGEQLYVDSTSRLEFLNIMKRDGFVKGFVTQFYRYDGSTIDISLNARQLEDTRTGDVYIEGFLADITDVKRAEEQLRLSENNLRITLDSISDGVISADINGFITRMNPTAVQLTGWNLVPAQGRPLQEVFHILNAKTRKRVENPATNILRHGSAQELSNSIILVGRDGKEYQIAESSAPIRDTVGKTVGIVLVFRDVTQTYAQADKIRRSEQQLKHITTNIPGVVCRLRVTPDQPFFLDYASEKLMTYFGIDPIGYDRSSAFLAEIPDNEVGKFLASIKAAAGSNEPWKYEGRFGKKPKKEIWFSGNAAPQREGEDLLYYGVLMDITKRKNWENSLAASERRFRTLFNEAPVMYVITEKREHDWYILEANTTFLNLLGYSQEEVVDTPLKNYFDQFSREEFFANNNYQHKLLDHSSARECCLVSKSGRYVYSLLQALPELDEQGIEWGSRSMFLDVTAIKKAEQETKRLQTALTQAQKMEAIGTLAGGIAHDFNNILSAVIGFSQLSLLDLQENSEIKKNINKILTAGMRAKDLVNQILTFSRQKKLEMMPLQIEPLLEESLKLLRASLPAHIQIVRDISAPIDNVMADPTQIHQILMNLCTNAAHAMENRGGTMTVSLHQVELGINDVVNMPDLQKTGSYVKINIGDTGNGINKDIFDKIFDPYFTTKEKGKGTGLGLSVVHGIVKSYGGSVEVSSTLGEGTTFTVYIPAIKQDSPDANQQARPIPRGNERIMLIDDEPAILEIGTKMLKRLGYAVFAYNDVEEALDDFSAKPGDYDLIITDVTMPKMTGLDLYERMRTIKSNLRVIFWTGYSKAMLRAGVQDNGIRDYLKKPIIPDQLAFKVREVLDRVENPPAEHT